MSKVFSSVTIFLALAFIAFSYAEDGLNDLTNDQISAAGVQSCGKENWLMRSAPGGSISPGFYPWMASIGNAAGVASCGGTILNDHEILTAAHCVADSLLPDLVITLGMHDISQAVDTNRVNVSSIRQHPGFRRNNDGVYENDLAVLTIPTLTFAPNIQPICLDPEQISGSLEGREAKVLGWGQLTEEETGMSQLLQELTLKIKPNLECSEIWDFEVGSDLLCMGESMRNICRGDDGGPLMLYDTNADRWNLAGVVSFYGPTCGDKYPALYARVSSYLDWNLGYDVVDVGE